MFYAKLTKSRSTFTSRGTAYKSCALHERRAAQDRPMFMLRLVIFGWHYVSNATCPMRPRLFYTFFVVSRMTMICYTIRQCRRSPALDK